MTVRKQNKSTLVIESTQEKIKVKLMLDNNAIQAVVSIQDKEIIVSKPGDYEYGGLSITAYEIPENGFVSQVNIVRIIIEGVSLLVSPVDREISKDIINNLANINILILPNQKGSLIKDRVSDFDPNVLCIVKEFGSNSNDFDLEDTKKALGLHVSEDQESIKYKSADFASSEESPLTTVILK
jgi:hypothetical protein